ncbi:DUF6587 family protein [Paraburkholderia tuberum]|uniref:Uncharacterized protein n=1 Tax=Paraburkholderia tuberum TaxID=157910 RepID=A0A1H1KJK4_9BURK|nr:hypothetical protein SAMN05445850_8043 [Paraburkholderia tuberum]
MTSSLWWQYAVIAVLVSVSLVYMFRKLAPQLATRLQAAASASLVQPRRMSALQALGRWLRPRQATGNCGDGCGTCGSCGTSKAAAARADVQPLEFRPRP